MSMEMPISRAAAYQKRNRTTHSWYGDWSSGADLMSRSCPPVPSTLEDHMRRARAARPTMAASYYQPSRVAAAGPVRGGFDVTDSSSSSAPVVIRAKSAATAPTHFPSSTSSSPGPTTAIRIPHQGGRQRQRRKEDDLRESSCETPSSAYSYDGGFFVTANNANKDFFVINPEWVSEDETVKKLSGGADAKHLVTQSKSKSLVDDAGVVMVTSAGTKGKGKDKGEGARGRPPPRVITWKSYKRSKSAPPAKYRNCITWNDSTKQ